MAVDRAPLLDRRFLDGLAALEGREREPAPLADLDAPIRPGSRLTARAAIALFDAQVGSRHLDLAARALRARGDGFYTIGSSGHEGNAAVAAALRPTDPAFLHYRSGALLPRARAPGAGPDAAPRRAARPVRERRRADRRRAPQGVRQPRRSRSRRRPRRSRRTCRKAVGVARRARARRAARRDRDRRRPTRSSSAPSATRRRTTRRRTGAINAAAWTAFQHAAGADPVRVRGQRHRHQRAARPTGWIAASYGHRPGIRYVAGRRARPRRRVRRRARGGRATCARRAGPAFLHLRTVRLLGHAGSDVEQTYRAARGDRGRRGARIRCSRTARLLVEAGARDARRGARQLRGRCAREVAALADEAARRPRLAIGRRGDGAARPARSGARSPPRPRARRRRPRAPRCRDGKLPEHERPRHLAVHINRALARSARASTPS